jgi:hypothetical protein
MLWQRVRRLGAVSSARARGGSAASNGPAGLTGWPRLCGSLRLTGWKILLAVRQYSGTCLSQRCDAVLKRVHAFFNRALRSNKRRHKPHDRHITPDNREPSLPARLPSAAMCPPFWFRP